jgi:uncharacterized protein YegL
MENINNLFATANDAGELSDGANAIVVNVAKGNKKISSSLGASVDNIASSEVVGVLILLDDSSSIQFAGNSQNVRDGGNMVVEALKGAKIKNNIQVSIQSLNAGELCPFSFLEDVPVLDTSNYRPNGGTPLYGRTLEVSTVTLAKIHQIRQAAFQERMIVIIVTDGGNTDNTDVAEVNTLITEIVMSESNQVFFIALEDGTTDFAKVAKDMGIPDNNVWLANAMDPKAIRRAFQTVSQSASASASAGTAGGFGL